MVIGPPDLIVGGENPNIARYIANAHTLFNVISTIFFLILLPSLVKITIWITPKKDQEKEIDELHHIKYMDTKFVDAPSVALTQARAEIIRMGDAVQVMYDDVINSLVERKIKKLSKWKKREDAVDILQKEIIQFLVQVAQKPISPEESREVASLMRMTNNLERVGDNIENIAELGGELIEQDLLLSEGGLQDYNKISRKVRDFLEFIINAIRTEDAEVMQQAQELENEINEMRDDMRGNYIVRLQSGICTVDPGLILVDMLTAFEKIGDFCYNIAQAVAGEK
jgi:phosphate:Na+ symporter